MPSRVGFIAHVLLCGMGRGWQRSNSSRRHSFNSMMRFCALVVALQVLQQVMLKLPAEAQTVQLHLHCFAALGFHPTACCTTCVTCRLCGWRSLLSFHMPSHLAACVGTCCTAPVLAHVVPPLCRHMLYCPCVGTCCGASVLPHAVLPLCWYVL
jgi:hypothetical protein